MMPKVFSFVNWYFALAPPAPARSDNGDGTFNVTGSHAYATAGSYHLSVSVTDRSGNIASAAVTSNAAVTAYDFSATQNVAYNDVVANSTPPDPNADASAYTATISWGDGQTSAGTLLADGDGTRN